MPKATGMRGGTSNRSRNTTNGRAHRKHGNTHVGTVEKTYGVDLGVRSDMHLSTYLQRRSLGSLNDLINGR